MVADRRRLPWSLQALAITLALAGLAVTVAGLAVDEALRRALEVAFTSDATKTLYPWTVRLDLVAMAILVLSIGVLAAASRQQGAGPRVRGPAGPRTLAWLGALVVPLAAAAGVIAGPAAALGTIVLFVLVLWLAPRLADGDDPWLVPLLALAFVARALVAVVLSAYGLPGRGRTVFDDEMAIYQAARQLEFILPVGFGDLTYEWRHLIGAQLDLMGTQFYLFGDNFTLSRVVNAALGTFAVAFAYAIGLRCRGVVGARAAAVVAAFWPTLVVWGGSGLREPMSILLTLIFPWLLIRRFGPTRAAERAVGSPPSSAPSMALGARPFVLLAVSTAVVTLLLLAVLRPPAALAIAAGLVLGALVVPLPRWRGLPRRAPVVAAAVVGLFVIGLSWRISRDPSAFLQQFTPRALEYRQAAAELTPLVEGDRTRLPNKPDPSFMVLGTIVRAVPPGGSELQTATLFWYTYDPPGYQVLFEDGTLADMPPSQVQHLTDDNVGWADVIRRPLGALRLVFLPVPPFGGQPLHQVVTAPDTILWDVLLVLAVVGVWRSGARAGPEVAMGTRSPWRSSMLGVLLVTYPLLMVLGMGLVATNLGTLLRHRGLIVPWLGMLAAPLLVALALRLRPAARRLPLPAAVGVAAAVLALVIGDVVLNARFAQVRGLGPPTAWTVLPWAARADLLVITALAGLVAWQLYRADPPTRGRADARTLAFTWAPGVGLGVVAGGAFGALAGVVGVGVYAVVLGVGPLLAGVRSRQVEALLATAVSLRLIAAIGLGVYGLVTHGQAVLDDEVALHRAGVELSAILAVGKGDLQPDWWHLPGPYLSSIGALYWLVDRDFALVRIVNAGVGALAVALVWSIARGLFGETPARVAGWLVALWPTFVFWNGTGLRESAFAFTSLLVPWLLLRGGLVRSAVDRVLLATATGLALFVMWTLREYAIVGIGAGLALAAAIPLGGRLRAHRRWALALAGVLLVALVGVSTRLDDLARNESVSLALGWVSPRGLEYRAAATELSTIVETDPRKRPAPPDPSISGVTTIVRVLPPGESRLRTGVVAGYEYEPFRYHIKFDKDTDVVVDPERVQRLTDANVGWDAPLGRLVDGLRLLVVPPAPWGSLVHAATIPDALAWDALAALAAYAVIRQGRLRRAPAWLVIVAFPIVMVLALGLASAYLGTVVRHRSMLAPWLAILAAPAVAELLRAWSTRRPAVASPRLAPVRPAGAVAGGTITDER
jgi:hypothetical protein